MDRKTKLQNLLNALKPDATSVDFAELDAEVEKIKKTLVSRIQGQTVEDVQRQLDKFKKSLDFKGLFNAVDNLEASLKIKIQGVSGLLNTETAALKNLLSQKSNQAEVDAAVSSIESLKQDLESLTIQKNKELGGLKDKISQLYDYSQGLETSILETGKSLTTATTLQIQSVVGQLEEYRREFIDRFNRIPKVGGGSMNRNIAIGGNTSVLSRYTDINIKAGSNVTLTYSNNDTTKYLDLTIASSGGGGSVSGTVRSINRVATSQAMGNNSGTDYVYVATAGIQLTLPDAAANTNLYTIKNTAASSVLVATTSAQTIDGQANLILATQYTSVDLVNDGNDNWGIT